MSGLGSLADWQLLFARNDFRPERPVRWVAAWPTGGDPLDVWIVRIADFAGSADQRYGRDLFSRRRPKGVTTHLLRARRDTQGDASQNTEIAR